MSKKQIYSALEQMRADFLSVPLDTLQTHLSKMKHKPKVVNGKSFTPSVKIENSGADKLLIVKLEKKGFFKNSVFSIGARFPESGEVKHLDNKQLKFMGMN